nr:uncharacterized protein I203_04891 [Kwoniella mangroviensis CBS 8507]OCF65871.1 hypothetical protein I203_04891 [Kwoniella mangroviensis CBS 8507]
MSVISLFIAVSYLAITVNGAAYVGCFNRTVIHPFPSIQIPFDPTATRCSDLCQQYPVTYAIYWAQNSTPASEWICQCSQSSPNGTELHPAFFSEGCNFPWVSVDVIRPAGDFRCAGCWILPPGVTPWTIVATFEDCFERCVSTPLAYAQYVADSSCPYPNLSAELNHPPANWGWYKCFDFLSQGPAANFTVQSLPECLTGCSAYPNAYFSYFDNSNKLSCACYQRGPPFTIDQCGLGIYYHYYHTFGPSDLAKRKMMSLGGDATENGLCPGGLKACKITEEDDFSFEVKCSFASPIVTLVEKSCSIFSASIPIPSWSPVEGACMER